MLRSNCTPGPEPGCGCSGRVRAGRGCQPGRPADQDQHGLVRARHRPRLAAGAAAHRAGGAHAPARLEPHRFRRRSAELIGGPAGAGALIHRQPGPGLRALLLRGTGQRSSPRPCSPASAGTQFLGALATYDALALCLLALGTWLAVIAATKAGPAAATLRAVLAAAGQLAPAGDAGSTRARPRIRPAWTRWPRSCGLMRRPPGEASAGSPGRPWPPACSRPPGR